MKNDELNIPLSERPMLSIQEASVYYRIGTNKLREMVKQPDCPFVIKVGRRFMIKRTEFDAFLKNAKEI